MTYNNNIKRYFTYFILILFSIYIFIGVQNSINPLIALNGWSPIDWVNQYNNPRNYMRDFHNGILTYSHSSFMYLYILASYYIDIEKIIPLVVFLEISLLTFSLAFFCNSIAIYLFGKEKVNILAPVLFSCIVISGTYNLDLGNFGRPTWWGLYYNFADCLRLLGLGLLLRKKLVFSTIAIGFSITIHPVMGIISIIFLVGFVLCSFKNYKIISIINAITSFSIILTGWALFAYQDMSLSVINSNFDPILWIKLSKLFNYHFFPLDYGLLTEYFNYRLFTLICITLLSIFLLHSRDETTKKPWPIIIGILLLTIFTIIGLLFSAYSLSPGLIKLALQRSSDLLSIITLGITTIFLYRFCFKATNPLTKALCCTLLLSPLLIKPGYPIIPALIFLIIFLKNNTNKLLLFFTIFLSLIIIYFYNGFIKSYNYYIITGDINFYKYFLLFYILFVIFSKIIIQKIIILIVFTFLFVQTQIQISPSASTLKLGTNFMSAQLWAKQNTDQDSLFMIDPTIYYGWRDFSERSSFGNLREWLHNSWLYSSDPKEFGIGQQRFGEFQIVLDDYYDFKPSSLDGFNALSSLLEKKFYALDTDELIRLSKKYSINYIVLNKNKTHLNYRLEKAYENDDFIVFKI